MSDFRAIAGVSATLRALLLDRIDPPPSVALDDVTVTIDLPRSEAVTATPPTSEPPRVNIFLYQVSQSPTLANRDMPGRGQQSSYGLPPLSLNLHFLITSFGSNMVDSVPFLDESNAQFLLGSVMRVLHDHAIITKNLLTVRSPVGQSILHPSLRDAFENLKICLDPVSIEDLTKIWTSLTIPYRLSAAYSVSVIQIESKRARRYPQLVGELPNAGPRVHIFTLQTPFIEALSVRRGAPPEVERNLPYVRVGDTLIITGQNLAGDSVIVALGDLELPVKPLSSQRIELVIPDASHNFDGNIVPIAPANRLQPGPHAVEVRTAPAQLPQAAAISNRAVMMLTPRVAAISSTPPRTLTINGARLFAGDLESHTLVGQALFDAATYTTATPTLIRFTLPDSAPYSAVNLVLSAPLAAFPTFAAPPQFEVTIGGGAAQPIHFSTVPTSFAEAAASLQGELRAIVDADAGYSQARVVATAERMAILPGGLTATVTIANTGLTNDADALGLTTLTSTNGYLGGALAPFVPLTTPPGALSVTFDTETQTVRMTTAPTSLADAATKLQTALRAASATPNFDNALVLLMGDQLLIVPGTSVTVDVNGVSGEDETTVAELQFRTLYPVRVRVNGVEAIGGMNRIELPL